MKMSKKEGRAVLLAAIVSAFAAGGANANAVYTYTGNHFTNFSTPPDSTSSFYTTSDFVTLTLTLTAPLSDNLNLVSIIPQVVDLFVSDGQFDYSLSSRPFTLLNHPVLEFSTNATGDITNWDVRLFAAPTTLNSEIDTSTNFDRGQLRCSSIGGLTCTGSNTNSPGAWTAAVPAPTIGAGIPGFVAACGGLLVWWRIHRLCGNLASLHRTARSLANPPHTSRV
jgi:hypothetical protein